jgi:uncharacterized membrane protein YraQ (UPF0718 family)
MEEHLLCFTQSLGAYARELLFPVFLGFFFSGLIHEFLPLNFVNKYLGDDSTKSIFMATWVGALLPVCCMGSLPIAITLRKKGARLGPVLAFLVATPATSAPALLMTWKLMGPAYTFYITAVVILMGLVMGLIGNRYSAPVASKSNVHEDCCCGVKEAAESPSAKDNKMTVRLMRAARYAFFDQPKEIGFQLLIGAVVASVIVAFAPVRDFVRVQLDGFKGYLILIAIGLIDYVCSTGSVPVANALVQSGVSAGKSLVYLLMGPITSYGTLLVIRKEFGSKILGMYLLVIAGSSILAGVLYDIFHF